MPIPLPTTTPKPTQPQAPPWLDVVYAVIIPLVLFFLDSIFFAVDGAVTGRLFTYLAAGVSFIALLVWLLWRPCQPFIANTLSITLHLAAIGSAFIGVLIVVSLTQNNLMVFFKAQDPRPLVLMPFEVISFFLFREIYRLEKILFWLLLGIGGVLLCALHPCC